jgi:hypothetical protein
MSTVEFVLLSGVRVGKYYKLITFRNGIRMTEIQLGRTDKKNLDLAETLGKLLEIRQYGRQYDPDILLVFEMPNSNLLEFSPSFGYSEAYIEYEPDTEKQSMERTQKRTSILKIEIEGNDWALRPENVVATQGIDLSGWAKDD